jgi:hypothetical protein
MNELKRKINTIKNAPFFSPKKCIYKPVKFIIKALPPKILALHFDNGLQIRNRIMPLCNF